MKNGPLGTNFSEILIEIQNFSFAKMHLKIWSARLRQLCPGEHELNGEKRTPPFQPILGKQSIGSSWINVIVALSNTCLMVCKILIIGYQLGTPDHIVYELLALCEILSDCYRSVWAIIQHQPAHILYLIAVCSCTKSQIIVSIYSVPHIVHVMIVYNKLGWNYAPGIHNSMVALKYS